MSEKLLIECRLCRKKKEFKVWDTRSREIDDWTKVCKDCHEIWAIGRRAMSAEKKDGKTIRASTANEIPMTAKFGNPEGPIEIKGSDIITALGGVRTRGAIGRFSAPKTEVDIVECQDKEEFYSWLDGGSEGFQVHEARAKAMKKIVTAFLNAIAKAKVEGMQEGRGLLAGLAKGTLQVADFSEISDRLAKGRKPKRD